LLLTCIDLLLFGPIQDIRNWEMDEETLVGRSET